jgi:tudor domain-containing protein 1/4/6/7
MCCFCFGCYRFNKSDSSHLSEKCLEQGDSTITEGIKIHPAPDRKATDKVSEHKMSGLKERTSETRTTGCYKPPVIPNMKVFEAIVSCIGDDGTIFVVPKLSGKVFSVMKDLLVALRLAAQVL